MKLYLMMTASLLSKTHGNLTKNLLIMRMLEYYDLNSFGVWRIIISSNVGDSHILWVVSFN